MSAAARAQVSAALVEYEGALRGMLARQAGATVLRFETPEDLYQGFATEALARSARFTDRGEGSARAWLFEVGRNYLRDRHRHWMALKRGSGRIVRSGLGAARSTAVSGGAEDPSASQTGPMTFAARREQLVLAAKALALLLPRDRQLVEWSAAGLPMAEMAERLGMSAESVGKARIRALERLRKTHELVLRGLAAND